MNVFDNNRRIRSLDRTCSESCVLKKVRKELGDELNVGKIEGKSRRKN